MTGQGTFISRIARATGPWWDTKKTCVDCAEMTAQEEVPLYFLGRSQKRKARDCSSRSVMELGWVCGVLCSMPQRNKQASKQGREGGNN